MTEETICSIIIPAYNAEKTICRCIESVTTGLQIPVEILVIDDGSTDGTISLCQELIVKDDRIRLIRLKHHGVSAARNHGIIEARGEWILFLDADDKLEERAPERLIRCAGEKTDAVCGVVIHGNWKGEKQIEKETFLTEKHVIMDRVLSQPTDLLTCHGWLLRRRLICENRLLFSEEMRIVEDSEWMLRVLNQCQQICLITYPVYRYTITSSSTIHRQEAGKTLEYVKALYTISKTEVSQEKNFPIFVLTQLLLILTHDTFFPAGKRSLARQIREAQSLREESIFKNALERLDVSSVGRKRRIVMICLKHGWMFPVWIAVRIRQLQNRLRAE